MSEIVATVMAGDPTEEELAAVMAALSLVRRQARPAMSGSRWARVGRLEAVGAAPGGSTGAGLTGWTAAGRSQ